MNRAHSLLPRLLLASTIAVSAVAPAAPTSDTTGSATGKRMHKPYTATATAVTPDQTSTAARVGDCAALAAGPLKVASDPEEGGQIARTATPKPTVGDMTVTKPADTASTKLMVDTAPASTCPAGH